MLLSRGARSRRRARSRIGSAAALALIALVAGSPSAHAQFASDSLAEETHKARLELFADRSSYEPGAAVRLAAWVTVAEGWHLQAHVPTYDYLIPTVLRLELQPGLDEPKFDYPAPHSYKFAFAEDRLDVYAGTVRILVALAVPAAATAGEVDVVATLRYQACDDKQCLPPVEERATIALTVGSTGAVTHPERFVRALPEPSHEAVSGRGATPSRWGMMFLALLGGLILNGMPCVLPILSLKLFGLVKSSGRSRTAVRAGALATTAGILVSFWALAGAAVAAKQAGAAIGWGVQFQQPAFVAFLAVVVLLFSLNLWGLFEIPLPARLTKFGDSGGGKDGLGGHFASGLFSTLMATPCSAPFLGTALSFALGQSGALIFAVLTAVGVGLALPYLLLVVVPGATRLLPRPGAWMDTLRGALGFLLAGAVVWLLFVLGGQLDAVSLALFEVGLLVLALFIWIRHRAATRGGRTGFAWLLVAMAAVGLVLFVARAPRAARADAGTAAAGAISWIPFDRAAAEQLASQGRLVFVDITADWCVTCKVNERIILNAAEVVASFREHDVVAMKADWTNRDDEIARFLAEHGRYGIPFYMLYRPGQLPHVFGELISKAGVIEVLRSSSTTSR